MYRAVPDGQFLVGNDEVPVDAHRPPEPLTLRARTERVVEGEEPGIGLLIPDIAGRAFEVLVEAELFSGIEQFDDRISFPGPERCLHRVCQPGVTCLTATGRQGCPACLTATCLAVAGRQVGRHGRLSIEYQ